MKEISTVNDSFFQAKVIKDHGLSLEPLKVPERQLSISMIQSLSSWCCCVYKEMEPWPRLLVVGYSASFQHSIDTVVKD